MADEEIKIRDVEDYKGEGEKVFSKEALIMTALQNCISSGSHEMREGYYNEKVDNFGNISRTYIEDTRKKFGACVEIALSLLEADFDELCEKNIKLFQSNLKKVKEDLLEQQWKWYEGLAPNPKLSYSGKIVRGAFTFDLVFYQRYLEYELITYRNILKELMKLIKRLDNFKGEDFEA